MKRKEKEREEQLALANELSRIVLTSSDITEIGQGFAFELKELMPVSWAAISLIEKSTDLLRLFPLSPKIDSNWELGDSIPLDNTPVAWLAQTKKALVEPDLKRESRFWTGACWIKHAIRAIVYMPLFSGGEVFGSLIFASNHPQAYGERELKLLKYAAAQLAAPVRHSEHFTHIIEKKQRTGQLPEEWMSRTEQALQELSAAIAEYAVHLKSHTAAIQGLSEASQELRQSAAEQNRVLANLVETIAQIPSRTEPVTASEQEPAPPIDKGLHPPAWHHSQRQSTQPQTLVEKQRKLLEKRIADKESGFRPGSKGTTERPSEPIRHRRPPRPPV
ncbi:MAG TPA: GAF domain-containing protein [Dehalococcoidia bacterium]|nr:GAF domain-containing protein [Dehalococcoidia bacterium]